MHNIVQRYGIFLIYANKNACYLYFLPFACVFWAPPLVGVAVFPASPLLAELFSSILTPYSLFLIFFPLYYR